MNYLEEEGRHDDRSPSDYEKPNYIELVWS
jgi:hypothetical protein